MKKLALIPLVLVLAGCGSGGGSGGTTPGGGVATAGDVAEQERELALQTAYDNGLDTCSQYPRKDVAAIYGVKNEPEAIAKAVASGEPDAELREQVRKGCLAAFE